MDRPAGLFSDCRDATDPAFIGLCTPRDGNTEQARAYVEELWQRYRRLADPHFVSEIKRQFQARFWEMYLACLLMDQGYELTSNACGPDLTIDTNGYRFHIEATAPKPGDPSKPDSLQEPEWGIGGTVPDEKIILRYRSALETKFNELEKNYVPNGYVKPGEAYIVALTEGELPFWWAEPEIPRILKAVFPIGPPQIAFDRDSMAVVKRGFKFRREVAKQSGWTVSTDMFLDAEYRAISGLIFSNATVIQAQRSEGEEIVTIHNPLADCPFPEGFLAKGREYSAISLDGETYKLTEKNWNEPPAIE